MNQRFTGYHVTAILVAFFAVVIAVNLTMARLATSTFGGVLGRRTVMSPARTTIAGSPTARPRIALGWDVATRVEGGHLILDTKGVSRADRDRHRRASLGPGR